MKTETKINIDNEILKLKSEPKQKIRFKQNFKNKEYMITIEKPKSMGLSIYLGECIFYNEMIKKPFVFGYSTKGYYDEEKLKLIKVLDIVEIDKPKSIFKRF